MAVYYFFHSQNIALEFSFEFLNPEFVLFVILHVSFERNELKKHTHTPKWITDPRTSTLVSRYLIFDPDTNPDEANGNTVHLP